MASNPETVKIELVAAVVHHKSMTIVETILGTKIPPEREELLYQLTLAHQKGLIGLGIEVVRPCR